MVKCNLVRQLVFYNMFGVIGVRWLVTACMYSLEYFPHLRLLILILLLLVECLECLECLGGVGT